MSPLFGAHCVTHVIRQRQWSVIESQKWPFKFKMTATSRFALIGIVDNVILSCYRQDRLSACINFYEGHFLSSSS